MKKKMLRNKVLSILLAGGFMSFALVQDDTTWTTIPLEELKTLSGKVGKFYQEKTRFSVKVTHQTFKGHEAVSPYDRSTGYMKRDGDNFHSYMVGIHTYQNKHFKFAVDTLQRTIIVSDRKPFAADEAITMENVLAQQHTVVCRKAVKEKQTVYRVDYKKDYKVKATELAVNTDHSLSSVTIYFRAELPVSENDKTVKAQPKAKIVYSEYNFEPVFRAGEFSHTPFFSVSGKKLVLNSGYKNYQLLDNRITKNQTND